ncbi:MAG: hypothetical protein R3B06_27115 [Kofleriaceae bacterium]
MALSAPVRIGVVAGAVGLALAASMVRFCGAIELPPKPPPPSESIATSRAALRNANNTESSWAGFLDKDALVAGVAAMTPTQMSKKLLARVDEARRSLAPGEPAVIAAGLQLTAEVRRGVLRLVIENQTPSAVAYQVLTAPRPAASCNLREVEPYDAQVIPAGGRVVRDECGFRSGMALDITRVETIELAPLQAYYLSKVPPRALGAEPRLALGHTPDLPPGQTVCSITVSQSLRGGLDAGTITWRDLVDFYARHRCETYRFPMEYKAFTRDGERALPAAE